MNKRTKKNRIKIEENGNNVNVTKQTQTKHHTEQFKTQKKRCIRIQIQNNGWPRLTADSRQTIRYFENQQKFNWVKIKSNK